MNATNQSGKHYSKESDFILNIYVFQSGKEMYDVICMSSQTVWDKDD